MSDGLLKLGRRAPQGRAGVALLQSGFRPFFLLAPVAATVALAGWLLVLHGRLALPGALSGVDLHAHEMVFGFVCAVIAGFLLTAVKNWTGRAPAPPRVLGALVALYLLGRVAVVAEAMGASRGVGALELAFLPLLAVAVARPILATRNWRNLGVAAIVALLAVADVLTHVAAWRGDVVLAASARSVALLLPCVLIAVIGGRVIPMFTRNVVLEQGGFVRASTAVDLWAVVAIAAVALVGSAAPWWSPLDRVEAGLSLAAGSLTLWRMRGWSTLRTRTAPLLWVLHLGHACLGLGLLARGAARLAPDVIPPSAATHLLAAGAIGMLCLGMMSRVALGHTGRPLLVPRVAVAGYLVLVVALVLRVGASWRPALLDPSAASFALAFLLFLAGYAVPLVRPRVDGAPG